MKIKIKYREIKEISWIAKKLNAEVYLVGGYVRDTILGIDCTDIDIMVIGDAIDFANKTAKHFNTELSAIYKKFGTALLNINNLKIEFSSARKESYKRESRKPEVLLSNLSDDLSSVCLFLSTTPLEVLLSLTFLISLFIVFKLSPIFPAIFCI